MNQGVDTVLRGTKAALAAPQPPELAASAAEAVRDKALAPFGQTGVLGVLAGVYIAFGGLFAIVALAGAAALPHGVGQVLAGAVFALGLVLVVVAGAELFTGNTLMIAPWLQGRLGAGRMLAAWGIVYAANLVGSVLVAVLALLAQVHMQGEGAVGAAALKVAADKTALSVSGALASGILANMLVCLAVWLAYSAATTTDKIVAVLLPIAAFVAAGLEHSVANMSLIPFGLLIDAWAGEPFWSEAGVARSASGTLGITGFLTNLIPVTIGNIIGGALVAAAYWLAYLRDPPQ